MVKSASFDQRAHIHELLQLLFDDQVSHERHFNRLEHLDPVDMLLEGGSVLHDLVLDNIKVLVVRG